MTKDHHSTIGVHVPPYASEEEAAAIFAALQSVLVTDARPGARAPESWAMAGRLEAMGQRSRREAIYKGWRAVTDV